MKGSREHTRYYAKRPRRVPPEFCEDDLLESCSQFAALLLYRLISQADDQGRLPGHPRYVKGVCFPMRPEATERKVEAALTELEAAEFLIPYSVGGRRYLQINRWQDLQGKWGRRAYPSRYPAPPGWTGDWVRVSEQEEIEDDAQSAPPDDEVRAPGVLPASKLLPPIPVPLSSSNSVSPADLSSPPSGDGGSRHVRHLFDQGRKRPLSPEEAFALGTELAHEEQARERVPT